MVGVIFYELFIVFGLPLYYTAIKSSAIPTHTLYNSRFHVYTLFTRFIYIIAVKYTLHTYQYIKLYTRYACHVLIIKSRKPLRKMYRLIPWKNLCNFVICIHVKMKLFE